MGRIPPIFVSELARGTRMPSNMTIAAFRYGYGLPLPAGAPARPEAMLAALAAPDLGPALWPGMTTGVAVEQMRFVEDARRRGKESSEAFEASSREIGLRTQEIRDRSVKIAVARALDSPDGLRERLVAFWADHFTVVSKNQRTPAMPSALVEDAIRPNLSGSFADLLVAVTLHPAMLMYLNQDRSIGPESPVGKSKGRGLNENLAREVMELHSLGVGGGYSQDDVRQMAELMTGLTVTTEDGFSFRDAWVEPGPETVLGVTYQGKGTAPIIEALRALAARPETAGHISHKLAVHFVSDDPDPDLVASMSAAWRDSGGNLMAVYAALLANPAAWAPTAGKVRQPTEFLIAALRGLGVTGADVMAMDQKTLARTLVRPMQAMGQPWQQAPGPNGWPEEPEKWINPTRLAARISWSMALPQKLADPLPDPRALTDLVLGDGAGEAIRLAVSRAESVREGVGLVLASPEFNRR